MHEQVVKRIPAKEITRESALYCGKRDFTYRGRLHRDVIQSLTPTIAWHYDGFVWIYFRDYSPLGLSWLILDENISVPVINRELFEDMTPDEFHKSEEE